MNALRRSMFLILVVALFQSGFLRADETTKGNSPSIAGSKAGEIRDDNLVKIKLIWCPAGRFQMGGLTDVEEWEQDQKLAPTQREVRQVDTILAEGFWLGQTEVTQSCWKRIMATTPWDDHTLVKSGEEYPAVCISWKDAIRFCNKFTIAERKAGRLPDDWEYNLPTEAQWEYACRAATNTRFSFEDSYSHLEDYAWYMESVSSEEMHPHQVGQKKPNAWGFFDMHGNVGEICRTPFATDDSPAQNVATAVNRPQSVTRGGFWYGWWFNCRSASRVEGSRAESSVTTGFRFALVRTGNPKLQSNGGKSVDTRRSQLSQIKN